MRSFTSIFPPVMVSFDLPSHNFSKREIIYNFPKIQAQKLLCQPIFAHNYYSTPGLFVRTYLGIVLEREVAITPQ